MNKINYIGLEELYKENITDEELKPMFQMIEAIANKINKEKLDITFSKWAKHIHATSDEMSLICTMPFRSFMIQFDCDGFGYFEQVFVHNFSASAVIERFDNMVTLIKPYTQKFLSNYQKVLEKNKQDFRAYANIVTFDILDDTMIQVKISNPAQNMGFSFDCHYKELTKIKALDVFENVAFYNDLDI